MTNPQIAPIVWDVLDGCAPSLQNLISWLEAADEPGVLAYAVSYRSAAEALTEAASGLTDATGKPISEDDSEDFRNWAVAQGQVTWQSVLTNASAAYTRYIARENRWDSEVRNPAYKGYQAPHCIAVPIFEERFGKNMLDVLDAIP